MARVQGHEENFIWNSVYIRKISHVCQKKRRCKMNLPSLRPSSHIWKSKASMYITEKPSSKAHTDNTRINTTRKSGKKKSRRRLMNPDLQMPSKKHTPRNAKLFSALSKSEQKNTINHHIMKQKSHKYYKFIDYVAKFWKKRLSLIHVHFFFWGWDSTSF